MRACYIPQRSLVSVLLRPKWEGNPKKRAYMYCCCCSVAQSCPTLCDPMDRSTSGLPVHHQLLEFTQTHVH